MSEKRMIVWLVVAILCVVGLHLAIDLKSGEVAAPLRRNALAPEAARATAFKVSAAGSPSVRLERSADGSWRLTEPYAASADASAAMRLADTLAFAAVDDVLSDSELLRLGRTRAHFGLVRPRASVGIYAPDGELVTVSFGSATPAGDGVYASVSGVDAVFAVSTNVLAATVADASVYRRRTFFDVTDGDIVAVDIRGGGGFVRLMRDNAQGWRFEGRDDAVASPRCAKAFLADILGGQAAAFLWPTGVTNETHEAGGSLLAGYGLDAESGITVTLKCADGRDRFTVFGADAGKGLVYALVENGAAIVTTGSAARDRARAGVSGFTDARLFPYDAKDVRTLSLSDGDATLQLARAEGGAWRIDAPVVASADTEQAQQLVARILALTAADVAAAGTDAIAVSFTTDAPPVQVSRKAVLAGGRFDDLRDRAVVRLKGDSVKRLVVTAGGEKGVAVTRDAVGDAWRVEASDGAAAGRVDGKAVAALVAALDPLMAERVEKLNVSASELSSYGLDTPRLVLAVDRFGEDSVRCNVLVGESAGAKGGCYATLGAADAVFVIPDAAVKCFRTPLLEKER